VKILVNSEKLSTARDDSRAGLVPDLGGDQALGPDPWTQLPLAAAGWEQSLESSMQASYNRLQSYNGTIDYLEATDAAAIWRFRALASLDV
jgi:hypothetical protein